MFCKYSNTEDTIKEPNKLSSIESFWIESQPALYRKANEFFIYEGRRLTPDVKQDLYLFSVNDPHWCQFTLTSVNYCGYTERALLETLYTLAKDKGILLPPDLEFINSLS